MIVLSGKYYSNHKLIIKILNFQLQSIYVQVKRMSKYSLQYINKSLKFIFYHPFSISNK